MKPEIDPKVDYAFNRLFGTEQTKDILIDLLNADLPRESEHAVVDVTLLIPINEKVSADDKTSALDIKARDQLGQLFNVETQMVAPSGTVSGSSTTSPSCTPIRFARATSSTNSPPRSRTVFWTTAGSTGCSSTESSDFSTRGEWS